ncbi:MAG TPA: hypothetical protein VGS06_19105 [Streptosporangiaceae bacterium]|nr:hypothetical protein [Streptosporangiaceae bacterium]
MSTRASAQTLSPVTWRAIQSSSSASLPGSKSAVCPTTAAYPDGMPAAPDLAARNQSLCHA